jgi:hypothetical protein
MGQRNYPSTYIISTAPPQTPQFDNQSLSSFDERKSVESGFLPLLPVNGDEMDHEEDYSLFSAVSGRGGVSNNAGNDSEPNAFQQILVDMSQNLKQPAEIEIDYGLSSRFSKENFERDHDLVSSAGSFVENSTIESSVYNPHLSISARKVRSKSAYPSERHSARPATAKQSTPSLPNNASPPHSLPVSVFHENSQDHLLYSKSQSQVLQAHKDHRLCYSGGSINSRVSKKSLASSTGGIHSTVDGASIPSSIYPSAPSPSQGVFATPLISAAAPGHVSIKRQIAANLETQFGIPSAKKATVPISIPALGRPPSPSVTSLFLTAERGGKAPNTAMTDLSLQSSRISSSSATAAAISVDNTGPGPGLSADIKYIGFGHSVRTYNDQAVIGMKAANSSTSSRGTSRGDHRK